MAKRRLNKKVALIGSAVLVVVLLGAIWIILRMSQDPEEAMREAEAAIAENDYKAAEQLLRSAYGNAKNDELRKDVLFKLADVYIDTDQWKFVRWCWDEIIRIDSGNVEARYSRLMYFYIVGNSGGAPGVWEHAEKQATEFLEVVERRGLLDAKTDQWDIYSNILEEPVSDQLGTLLYFVRGRAHLELVAAGRSTNPEESLSKALENFERVLELEPTNVDAYYYLAQAEIERGELLSARGSYTDRDKVVQDAVSLLERAVETVPDDPQAHVNLLEMRLNALNRSGQRSRENIEAVEPQYEQLRSKFPASPEVYRAIARFCSDYSSVTGPQAGIEYMTKAIQAAEKAMELEPEDADYATHVANLYYRSYCLYGDAKDVKKAVDIAKHALTLPNARETEGPNQYANLMRKYGLHSLIAHCAIEQILDSPALAASEREEWLREAESAVHAIEQIQVSEDNPQVIQWRGMLDLAKGNRRTAVRELYAAYRQLRALKTTEPPWNDLRFGHLCYRLALIFEQSDEDGAVLEFLVNALNSYIATLKPEARLDYAEVALKFGRWASVRDNIDAYERRFGPTDRSVRLGIVTDIGSGQFDQAAEALAQMNENDPNALELQLDLLDARMRQLRVGIIQQERQNDASAVLQADEDALAAQPDESALKAMRADLTGLQRKAAALVQKMLDVHPDSLTNTDVIQAARFYVEQDEVSNARALLDAFLTQSADATEVKVFRASLAEPDPTDVSAERYKEIRLQVLAKIPDAAQRALEIGKMHYADGALDKARAEFQKVLDASVQVQADPESLIFEQPEAIQFRRTAAGYLFDMALRRKELDKAEEIAALVKRENLDACNGQIFAARLAMARKDFESALANINACLTQRPVFSRAYMLRANINSALDKDEMTVLDDMRRASSLNPREPVIAKGLVDVLYRRNVKLGSSVTPSQEVELRNALEGAIRLNPQDIELLELYAAYVAEDQPLRAVAILQNLVRISPTMEHILQLGKLATQVARDTAESQRRAVLFDIAGSAFEQAREMNPTDETMLSLYADYYQARGQDSKALELLQASREESLLWKHYLDRGQYEQAIALLEKLYEEDPKDRNVVVGLLLASERTNDAEGVKKYGEQLVALDRSNSAGYLVEIQSYLKVGLVSEAERKLESYTEKFPEDTRTLLLQAWLAMRKGKLEEAIKLANRSIEVEPENAAGWRLRGEIRFFMADYAQAVDDLKRSKALLDDPQTRVSLAKAYMQQRLYEDAVTELKNTINQPGAPPEARVLLEQIYVRLNRRDALKNLYEDTLERYPESVQWLNRAGSFAISAGQFDKAEQLYDKACTLRREQHQSQNSTDLVNDSLYLSAFDGYLRALVSGAGEKGTGRWYPKKLEKVFEEGRQWIDSEFAPIVYFRMAHAKLKLGDRQTAVNYCHRAVDAAENNEALASEVLLRMYLLLGPEEVARYCQEKLASNPDSLPAHYTLFNLYRMNGEYNKALDSINKCIDLVPTGSSDEVKYRVKKAEVLTLAYDRSSDKQYLRQAISEYASLAKKMPNNTSVLNNLAYMLADNDERLKDALAYAEKAVALKPNEAGILDTYAYVLHKNGRNSEALEKLLFAVQQYEQNNATAPTEVYEHLGMVREALGAKPEALAAYREALELGADNLSEASKARLTKAIERLSR